jgi:hypothetical protein
MEEEEWLEKRGRKVYVLADKYHKGIHSSVVGKKNNNSEMVPEESEHEKIYYNYSSDEGELFAKVISWYQEHAK